MKFSAKQIRQYFSSACRDLKIAQDIALAEVRFKFAYEAFIKFGIALIAKEGFKVRSQPGHHVKIIQKMAELLKDQDLEIMGNRMRQCRNSDFYDGGILVTQKESDEYLAFVKSVAGRR